MARSKSGIRTLAIDIGGTGLKAIVLDEVGTPLTERVRVETPRPATPSAVMEALRDLTKPLGAFDRISCGFPGVVVDGVTRSAPNLHVAWAGFRLEADLTRRLRKPARALNDAGVQGFGVIERRGVEMVLTLGTGMGCALYLDGRYVPNLELAHHPFKGKRTYEQYVGDAALESAGKKSWNRRVRKVLEQVMRTWNPRVVYVGGGNAKHLKGSLPDGVKLTDNIAGLLGGIALWRDA
ncbi:MAG: ROK family protein [Myxococcales bacterium]|nr:ROK family protein [Myxococcales bacterium]